MLHKASYKNNARQNTFLLALVMCFIHDLIIHWVYDLSSILKGCRGGSHYMWVYTIIQVLRVNESVGSGNPCCDIEYMGEPCVEMIIRRWSHG